MYTQMQCNKDIMDKQVKDCINRLFIARSLIKTDSKLTKTSKEDMLVLLHEAADLLAMRV